MYKYINNNLEQQIIDNKKRTNGISTPKRIPFESVFKHPSVK
jgi:hypothetical protein